MRHVLVIDAVNDIEALTTHLGGKIWQKIMIIETERGPAESGAPSLG
ncbi:MAG: hypothetical protein AAGH48_11145 [Pseudomonadota bacterium]